MLTKQDDGSFVIQWPIKPTANIPFIDANQDYGLFVRHVLELPVFPNGSEIIAYGEKIGVEDMAEQFAKGTQHSLQYVPLLKMRLRVIATGKNIVFQQISVERFKQNVEALGLPPHIVLDLTESFQSWDEFGCKYYCNCRGN
jgi:hypothetical protein